MSDLFYAIPSEWTKRQPAGKCYIRATLFRNWCPAATGRDYIARLHTLSRFASIKHDCSYKIFIYITPGEVAELG